MIAELHNATRGAGLEFGLYYSLLDWAHEAYPDRAGYVDAFMRPQINELVERFAPAVLWGDAQWGHGPEHWRSPQIIQEYREAMARRGLTSLINDRWWVPPDFISPEYDVPADPPAIPWELCRGMTHSFCYNRAEREEHHLSAFQIVDLLTEIVAKGGNFLLNIGPRADGTIPELQSGPLREAGRWINKHAAAIDGSRPFEAWGDAGVRYTVTPATGDAPELINAIQLAGDKHAPFMHLDSQRWEITSVSDWDGAPLEFESRPDGLAVQSAEEDKLASVVRIVARARKQPSVSPPATPPRVSVGERRFETIGEALAAAGPGDTVEIGAGVFADETLPLTVPTGVAVCGAREGETVIDARGAGGMSPPPLAVLLLDGAGAGIERLTIRGAPKAHHFLPANAILCRAAPGARVESCLVEGGVLIATESKDLVVKDNAFLDGGIWLRDCDDARITGNRQRGNRWSVGIAVEGGQGAVVSGNIVEDALAGIRLKSHSDGKVSGNNVTARWWGIHLEGGSGNQARGNTVRETMRGLTLSGGSGVEARGNQLSGCDTGILVEARVEDGQALGNEGSRCRIGLMLWEATRFQEEGNRWSDSFDRDRYDRRLEGGASG